jgi:hypothetical protein
MSAAVEMECAILGWKPMKYAHTTAPNLRGTCVETGVVIQQMEKRWTTVLPIVVGVEAAEARVEMGSATLGRERILSAALPIVSRLLQAARMDMSPI